MSLLWPGSTMTPCHTRRAPGLVPGLDLPTSHSATHPEGLGPDLVLFDQHRNPATRRRYSILGVPHPSSDWLLQRLHPNPGEPKVLAWGIQLREPAPR